MSFRTAVPRPRTPFVDFSETSTTVDYTTRLISSGGTLNVYTTVGGVNALQVNGGLGISGNSTATGAVQAGTDLVVDGASANAGTLANGLRFGNPTGGQGIASRRTTGSNQFGLDFYTASAARLSIANGGSVGIGPLSLMAVPFDAHYPRGRRRLAAPRPARATLYEC